MKITKEDINSFDSELPDLYNKLGNFWWRINNLYEITNSYGERVIFRPNYVQELFFSNMHIRNIVLKSRQHGITTANFVMELDAALFNSNCLCGFICDTLPASQKLFHEKVLRTYEALPEWLKEIRPLLGRDKMTLRIDHGEAGESSMVVGTSLRSGTYNYIHISEIAKLCLGSAEKERELVSGTLQSGYNCIITLESTSEGKGGFFYNTCQRAERLKLSGKPLTDLDYAFHFYPWYIHPESVLPSEQVDLRLINLPEWRLYFERECSGIELSPEQKMWYIKKREEMDDVNRMFKEYPSNSAEAFKSAIQGAYFYDQLNVLYEDGRLLEGYEL